MRLEEFTYVPLDGREKGLKYLANLIGDPAADPNMLQESLERSLTNAVASGTLIFQANEQWVLSEQEADTVSFRTEFHTPTGEEILARCTPNRNPNKQRWFGLFFQPVRREGFVIGDLYFKTWTDGGRFLEELAEMAIPEKWSYNQYASKQTHPILKSYIEKTYERVKQQQRIVRGEGKVLFNTGLINSWFKEIYITAEIDPENSHRLLNARPLLENERLVLDTFRNQKPAMATFFTELTDVVFDPDLDVLTDDAHIIEDNWDRVPQEYQKMRKSQVFALFQSAIEFARIMARRNYKLIVPQFYKEQIQFLMPIYLSGEFTGSPDFALVLEKINDCYRGNTILTLDMAYQNARLIAKPDSTWLDPDAQPA